MSEIMSGVLEALAASFEQRAQQALESVTYTRSGYLSRDSVGLRGLGIGFETAARELRAALTSPPTAPGGQDDSA